MVDETAKPDNGKRTDDFFRAGEGIHALKDAINPSAGPVLEQLGPAPFRTRAFPLLGFLATLYEHVAASASPDGSKDGGEHEPT